MIDRKPLTQQNILILIAVLTLVAATLLLFQAFWQLNLIVLACSLLLIALLFWQATQQTAVSDDHHPSIETLFARYVGSDIANSILAGDGKGQQVEATVLFADIRDFTGLSEQTELTTLLDELNAYYDAMQQAIEAEGGVINKFGGDSLLALFGAPTACEDHAKRAVQAAQGMMKRLATLNEQRQANGRLPIHVGIGISSGQMIAGEVGSRERHEYTVLGDSVNIAKRLSDLNKQYQFCTIFLSENTRNALTQDARQPIVSLGNVSVKGKGRRVNAFTLLDTASEQRLFIKAMSQAAG